MESGDKGHEMRERLSDWLFESCYDSVTGTGGGGWGVPKKQGCNRDDRNACYTIPAFRSEAEAFVAGMKWLWAHLW